MASKNRWIGEWCGGNTASSEWTFRSDSGQVTILLRDGYWHLVSEDFGIRLITLYRSGDSLEAAKAEVIKIVRDRASRFATLQRAMEEAES